MSFPKCLTGSYWLGADELLGHEVAVRGVEGGQEADEGLHSQAHMASLSCHHSFWPRCHAGVWCEALQLLSGCMRLSRNDYQACFDGSCQSP